MVLINDKKFACATCIKGHRVSGCTHTDRPLFEIKKKGRPSTQCQCCKDRRKGNAVHTKCTCGDAKPPSVIMPNEGSTSIIDKSFTEEDEDLVELGAGLDVETRKGVPGSNPTFPNGLRDVHEMSAAAEALTSIGDDSARIPERSVKNLLNPCSCKTTGLCKCCEPKRPRRPSHSRQSQSASSADGHSVSSRPRSRSGSRTPIEGSIPDSLAEMLKNHTTLSPSEPHNHGVGSSSLHAPSYLSPDDMHHPRHTSPHVHKTKLYSPYSTNGHSTPRHMKRESSSTSSGRPSLSLRPPSKLRPLTDVGTLLGAALQPDGSLSTSIPRSAVGLPGITTFDAMAQNGGVKIEALGIEDVDMPLAFPTAEDVVIGACTCGDDCECPGCATHSTGQAGEGGHAHEGPCGEMCKSSSNCGSSVCIPSGITSIQQLLSLASENVPSAPSSARPFELNAFDTAISPPSVQVSEDAANLLGYVHLKPLECCNGRCQCAPGSCSCAKDCCGCCIRCACAEEDGDAKMASGEEKEKGGCCAPRNSEGSALTPPRPASLGATTPPRLSPIPGGSASASASAAGGLLAPLTPPDTIDPRLLSSAHASPLLGPVDALHPHPSRPPSPHASGTTTPTYPPPPALRRSASTSQGHKKTSSSSNGARRATVTAHTAAAAVSRSASTSKAHAKGTAAGHAPGHHRPILPKPSSHAAASGPLGVPKGVNGSSGSGSGSNHPSRVASPAPQPRADQPTIQITSTDTDADAGHPGYQRPMTPSTMSNLLATNGGFELPNAVNDQEWLAFLNHLNATDPAYLQHVLAGNIPPDLSLPPGLDINMAPTPPFPFGAAVQQVPGADGTDYQGMYDLIAQALASQSQPPAAPPALSNSSQSDPPSRDPFAQGSGEGYGSYVAPTGDPAVVGDDGDAGMAFSPDTLAAILATYQWAPNGAASQSAPDPVPSTAAALPDYHAPPAHRPPVSSKSSGERDASAFPMGGFAPGFPQETVFSSFGKHMQGSTAPPPPPPSVPAGSRQSVPPSRPSVPPNSASAGAGAGPTAPPPLPSATPASTAGDINPNLIDLSKPLNPQDVDRIIRALQRQTADSQPSSNTSAPGAPPPPPPTAPLPQAHERIPQIMNALSQSQSNLQPSGVFDLGTFLGYRQPDQVASVPLAQETGTGEDLFSKYIFDNPSEGLDLSALDLGGAHPGQAHGGSGEYTPMFQVPSAYSYSSTAPPPHAQNGAPLPPGLDGAQSQGWSKYSTQLHGHGGTTTDTGEEGENRMWGWRNYQMPDDQVS